MPQLTHVKKALDKELGKERPNPLNIQHIVIDSLMCACGCDDIKTVKFLINNNHTDANVYTYKGMTPLMIACANGYLEIARFLVKNGNANIDAQTELGTTALMLACNTGSIEIVDFLIHEAHADITLRDNRGHSALSTTFNNEHPNKNKLIEILTNAAFELFEPSVQEDNNIYEFIPVEETIKNDLHTSNLTNSDHSKIELIGTEEPNQYSYTCVIF